MQDADDVDFVIERLVKNEVIPDGEPAKIEEQVILFTAEVRIIAQGGELADYFLKDSPVLAESLQRQNRPTRHRLHKS